VVGLVVGAAALWAGARCWRRARAGGCGGGCASGGCAGCHAGGSAARNAGGDVNGLVKLRR
jgi:hypothetical protein